MLVPCVVKEAVSKFDAGRDGKKEKREQRETRRLFSEGGRKGGRDARKMDHPRSSEHRFFFFFTSGETKTRASVLNRAEGTVWFSRERGLEFPFLSRNLPNNIRKNKISEIF